MLERFGDLRESVQRAHSDGGALGELVFYLRYLVAIGEIPTTPKQRRLHDERLALAMDYTRSSLSRVRPANARCSHWDIVSFCLEGAPALEERAARGLWGNTRDEAIRDARHWLASLAWALGSGFAKAQLHATIRSTATNLLTAWSPSNGTVSVVARPSTQFVRDQWGSHGGEASVDFPGVPEHLYHSMLRAERHRRTRGSRRTTTSSGPGITLGDLLVGAQ